MLSDLTEPGAVRNAAAEFDKLGRDEFLRRYGYRPALRYFARIDGRDYDSKALVGVAHGLQHPEKGRLAPSEFSGGEATVLPTLERLGFEVVDRREEVMAGLTSLDSLLHTVCELLHQRHEGSEDFSGDDLNTLIQNGIAGRLAELAHNRAEARGRTGIGTPADVPWVSLFPVGHGSSAQHGYYLVYLFSKDGSAAFLSLNQGTEGVKGGIEVIHKRTLDLRRAAGNQPDLLTEIDLRSQNARPKKYEAGSAYALRYERGRFPPEHQLAADLHRMLALLETVAATGLRWDPVNEPVHLVFKWNADLEPRTIDLHRMIAEEQGSVWWGRFAASAKPSIAARRLAQLQQQLAQHTPTHAYLYRRGSLWRASVLDATVQPPDFGDVRFPRYYKPEDCNLFVRLNDDFMELPSDWLPRNAVLASQPETNPDRLASALGNQTTPLFIFELAGAEPDTTLVAPLAIGDDDLDISDVTLSDVCRDIAEQVRLSGLDYGPRHDVFVRTAVVSLATKRLLLLTGLSGSGKTRLAIAIGQWFGADRLAVVPVRPDWTGPEALFGFEDGLSLLVDGKHAWMMTDVLQFVLRAARDPQHPYLLLLDEMNLAHVERYFADALSGMESGAAVVPSVRKHDAAWRLDEPPLVPFPSNLFVVGTVNIDETTYMFSPKVLDRANTIEFRVLTEDLQAGSTALAPVEAGSPTFVRRFLTVATTVADDDWTAKSQLAEWLQELHSVLCNYDREFGHRVFFEALRFGSLLAEAGEDNPLKALDLQVMQKVLPRMHGSLRQIGEPLHALASWCWHGPASSTPPSGNFDPLQPPSGTAALPQSFDKIKRMTRRLRANHFVGFAE